MWEILTNYLYLYLFIHQHELKKVNYTELSKKTHKHRQTLSKYYSILLEEEIIGEDEKGLIIVNDFFNLTEKEISLIKEKIDVYPSGYIAYLIYKGRFPIKTDEEICKKLNIGYNTLRSYKKDISISNGSGENYVYAIVQDKVIKYVGSTEHLEERIYQHCQKRPFLDEKDFIILEKCNRTNRFDRESFYRKLFNPEWNDII